MSAFLQTRDALIFVNKKEINVKLKGKII